MHFNSKKMYKNVWFAACLLFTIVACKQGESNTDSDPILTKHQLHAIDSICEHFIAKGNTVGLALGLAQNDSILFTKGYGLANLSTKSPITPETIFPIASVSKFITALITMKLVEDGKCSLDDKVVDYLPNFPNRPFMDKITIEHLLRHQSGLIDHEDWFDSLYIHHHRVFTDAELYTFLDKPLFFQPGSHYSYSNAGYAILSRIIEVIENDTFHNIIQKIISRPLSLPSIGMWPQNWHSSKATMGYEVSEETPDTSFHMMTKGMKGDGGLSSSLIDLLKLMQATTNGSFLSKSSLDKIISPTHLDALSIDYGLGVKFGLFNSHYVFGHSGGYKGTGWAMLAHYPKTGFTFAAVINTNYSPEEVWMLRHRIMPIVLNESPPALVKHPVAHIEKFVGTYVSMDRWGNATPNTRIITQSNGQLFYDNPNTETPGAALFQIEPFVFSWQAYPYDRFLFHEKEGEIIAVSTYADGFFTGVRTKEQ